MSQVNRALEGEHYFGMDRDQTQACWIIFLPVIRDDVNKIAIGRISMLLMYDIPKFLDSINQALFP